MWCVDDSRDVRIILAGDLLGERSDLSLKLYISTALDLAGSFYCLSSYRPGYLAQIFLRQRSPSMIIVSRLLVNNIRLHKLLMSWARVLTRPDRREDTGNWPGKSGGGVLVGRPTGNGAPEDTATGELRVRTGCFVFSNPIASVRPLTARH